MTLAILWLALMMQQGGQVEFKWREQKFEIGPATVTKFTYCRPGQVFEDCIHWDGPETIASAWPPIPGAVCVQSGTEEPPTCHDLPLISGCPGSYRCGPCDQKTGVCTILPEQKPKPEPKTEIKCPVGKDCKLYFMDSAGNIIFTFPDDWDKLREGKNDSNSVNSCKPESSSVGGRCRCAITTKVPVESQGENSQRRTH